jgi:flagellar hook assembly protein FlgD
VATLASGAQPAGLQSVTWDGRDSDGREVAAGTYLLRLSWGGAAAISERIVVVR